MLYALVGANNVHLLAACVFIGMMGLIQMEVMADSMCVERSKFERDERRGQIQATGYCFRFAGGMFGSLVGASVCNKAQWGWGLSFFQIAFIHGLLPLVLVSPWLYP
jgi:hypothetical protein